MAERSRDVTVCAGWLKRDRKLNHYFEKIIGRYYIFLELVTQMVNLGRIRIIAK